MFIKRYFPANSVDAPKVVNFEGADGSVTDEQYEFQTAKELFNIEWIKRFRRHKDFFKYTKINRCLIAEYQEGFEKHLIGIFNEDYSGLEI